MIIHDGTTFVLYTQEQTKLETCKLIVANMQLKIKLPHQIKWLILSLLSIWKHSLSIVNHILIRARIQISESNYLTGTLLNGFTAKRIENLSSC